jgi:hypothetical protein
MMNISPCSVLYLSLGGDVGESSFSEHIRLNGPELDGELVGEDGSLFS